MITTKDKVDHFKSELYQYNFCRKKVEEYTLSLEVVAAKLYEVASPQMKSVILENNRNPKRTNILELMEQEERLVKERNTWAKRVSDVDKALESISIKDRELLIDLCIRERSDPKKTTYFKKSDELGISDMTLKRRVESIIEEIIKNSENVI